MCCREQEIGIENIWRNISDSSIHTDELYESEYFMIGNLMEHQSCSRTTAPSTLSENWEFNAPFPPLSSDPPG